MKTGPIDNWLVNGRASAIQSGVPKSVRRNPDDPSQIAVLATIAFLNATLWVLIVWALAPVIQAVTNGAFESFPLLSDRTLWIIGLVWPLSLIGLALTGKSGDRATNIHT